MVTVIVVNLKSTPVVAVKIDRSTMWGNPFQMGRDGTREEVIKKFRVWGEQPNGRRDKWLTFWRQRMAKRTGAVKIGCHCAPEACHGDVYVEWLRKAGMCE